MNNSAHFPARIPDRSQRLAMDSPVCAGLGKISTSSSTLIGFPNNSPPKKPPATADSHGPSRRATNPRSGTLSQIPRRIYSANRCSRSAVNDRDFPVVAQIKTAPRSAGKGPPAGGP